LFSTSVRSFGYVNLRLSLSPGEKSLTLGQERVVILKQRISAADASIMRFLNRVNSYCLSVDLTYTDRSLTKSEDRFSRQSQWSTFHYQFKTKRNKIYITVFSPMPLF
jgi:hypothetical protein